MPKWARCARHEWGKLDRCFGDFTTDFDTGAPSIRMPHVLRRRRGSHSLAGIEDLIEGYLRWSLAETRSHIAELKRRQVIAQIDTWVAEVCCGASWIAREADTPKGGPWKLLQDVFEGTDVGRDTYIEIPSALESQIRQLAVVEIQRTIPDLWERVRVPAELDPNDYNALDLACLKAYEILGRQFRLQGNAEMADILESADPGNGSNEWDEVLQSVVERLDMWQLAEPFS